MAEIFPFYGLRYNAKKVKNLNKIFAPPYDIISEKEQKKLYRQHPFNVVRLILGNIYPKDSTKNNRYTRAANFLNRWIKNKILIQEAKPAIYIYVQDYRLDGTKKTRIGFIARIKLDDKKGCLPHEHTLVKPKEDRLMLLRAVRANLSPIFSFYLDKKDQVEKILQPFTRKQPILNFIDKDKIRHKFWQFDDEKAIKKIRKLMQQKHIFIADGHHRYEVALTFRDEMRQKGKQEKNGFNYVMMYFTSFNEKNLSILPTHRILTEIDGLEDKIKILDQYFKKIVFKKMGELFLALRKNTGFSLGMYYQNKFYLLKIKNRTLQNRLMKKTPATWKNLEVALLNKIVLEHIFRLGEQEKEEKICYARDPKFAVKEVNKQAKRIAFFLNPTKPEQVKNVALSRNRMPQKSTYFYPKLITGLVINKF